jgi:hypothetical protein
MAVSIDSARTKIFIDIDDAKPDSKIDTQKNVLLGHLTRGWDGSNWNDDAVVIDAIVPINGPKSETDKVELGFVQIARATDYKAFYAGRMASEGSIILDYFIPPALPSPIMLDGLKDARDPWYRNPVIGGGAKGRTAAIGDHPGLSTNLVVKNKKMSYVKNFLFHVIMEREFWSVLTTVEPGGKPNYLAYVQWQLRYEFKLRWANEIPIVASNSSSCKTVLTQTAGRPPDADIQALLSAPAGDRANKVAAKATIMTDTGPPPNRQDLDTRFSNLPPNFWT